MARRTATDPNALVSAETLPQLDPHCPPAYVRRKKDGLVTRWSTLFKKNIHDFEPFYREGTDDAYTHMLAIQNYQAHQARFGGGLPVMSMGGMEMLHGDLSGTGE